MILRVVSIIASTVAISSAVALLCLCSNGVTAFLVVSPSLCLRQNHRYPPFASSKQMQRTAFSLNGRQRIRTIQMMDGIDPNTGTIDSATMISLEQEISSMRVSAIKQELESYGISTKTFLEKSELITALVQARHEGKTPIVKSATSSSSSSTATASSSSTSFSSSNTSSSSSSSTPMSVSPEERKARIQVEMENLQSLKVSDLKSQLEDIHGISTKSYFEKSEFVRALAEARVDGVTKEDGSKKNKTKKRRGTSTISNDNEEEEEEEVVKAKVEVITNDSVGPRTKKSRDNDATSSGRSGSGSTPFGGGNPFGGGMPGGMGGMDMGNIADMLKGMGGMGGASNPFGGGMGGGAGGMADAMKAAQQAMSNPKVRAVIDKAQKNPKVMAAVQECMGNPMAMAKYMSDPEVGPILKELQDAMT